VTDSVLEQEMYFQIQAAGLPEPLLQFRPVPVRRWRCDFAWVNPEARLILELEGATWAQGRHTRGAGFEADCIKYDELVLAGWRIIRVTSGMVHDGRALTLLERALQCPGK
jgi:very-short-patch-repair endonuclease